MECDGERRGRGRVLAAGRRREKKLHAAILRGKKQARARGMRGVLRFLPHTTIDQRVGVCVWGGGGFDRPGGEGERWDRGGFLAATWGDPPWWGADWQKAHPLR